MFLEQQKNELVAKLEDISEKYAEVVAIQSEMESFTPEDHYQREISVPKFPGEYENERLREIWRNENPAIRFSGEAKAAFLSQMHAETLNEQNNLYQEMFDLGFETVRGVEEYLEGYCFAPDTLDRKIAVLSGGEKNLLQLAKLAVGEANLLLLDEPSSHLDTYAQMALEKAIVAYRGAVLMVSHDFYSIVNCADTILYVENGTIRPMSSRAFRKMIYKHHFSREYLELETKKQDLETRIARCLESYDYEAARALCEELGSVIESM